jgi:hypothetical protein
MLRIFFRDVASWRQVYFAAKPFHVGVDVDRLAYSLQHPAKPSHVEVDVDELACFLHRPMACSRQRGGQCCLTSAVLSRRSAMGGDPFLGV